MNKNEPGYEPDAASIDVMIENKCPLLTSFRGELVLIVPVHNLVAIDTAIRVLENFESDLLKKTAS